MSALPKSWKMAPNTICSEPALTVAFLGRSSWRRVAENCR
jgi:hypothetical protein